jgi:hypothetical protein
MRFVFVRHLMSSKSVLKARSIPGEGARRRTDPCFTMSLRSPNPVSMKERQAAANLSFPIARTFMEGIGGARRDRTDDLMLAKHPLYQLSYGPI